MQKITPFLWFDDKAEEEVAEYLNGINKELTERLGEIRGRQANMGIGTLFPNFTGIAHQRYACGTREALGQQRSGHSAYSTSRRQSR